jgi:hypothetical protein
MTNRREHKELKENTKKGFFVLSPFFAVNYRGETPVHAL